MTATPQQLLVVLKQRKRAVNNVEYLAREVHEEYARRMEDEHKRFNKRLEKCEEFAEQMQKMNTNIGNLAINMKHLLDEQVEQRKRLDKIEDEPKNTWQTIKNGLLSAIGAAIGGSIIAAIIYFM